jgi:polyhydroxybutyrate depolymerase
MRKTRIRHASVALLLALLTAASATAENKTYHLTFGGMQRDYIVHAPPAYREGGPALPVVLALHGGGGSAESMEERYGLDASADSAGMIVVYPDGVSSLIGRFHTWNAGACCGRAKRENSDDTGFLSAVIDAVVRDYGADAKHVFVTGHSNGAMMAYRLACAIPGKLAAIAPVAGESGFDCPGARTVPVLHIHGTEDHCVLYGGGQSCGGCFSRAFGLPTGGDAWPCPAVEQFVAATVSARHCGAAIDTVYDKGTVLCKTWKDCPAGAGVTLCRVAGGGHEWQGSAPPAFCAKRPDGQLCRNWNREVGPMLPGVETNRLIFDFFSGIAKPPSPR